MTPHDLDMKDVSSNDVMTAAALGVLAMCMVTFDHEALGHGGLCLALGGRITLLTTSLFACDLRTIWLAPAGPFMNIFMGSLALIALRLVPAHRPALKVFLILVTAFSYFWEGGYIVQAMIERKGDMYYAIRYTIGEPSLAGRMVLAVPGIVLYVLTVALTRKNLIALHFGPHRTQAITRAAWLAATLSAFAASLLSNHGWSNVRDSVMSIGLASVPLLLLSFPSLEAASGPVFVKPNPALLVMATLVFFVFAATMGRGLG